MSLHIRFTYSPTYFLFYLCQSNFFILTCLRYNYKPDSMPWSTLDIYGSYILGPTYYGNTVITFIKNSEKSKLENLKFKWFFSNFVLVLVFTCPNDTIAYENISCLCDVNSISVGAVPRCSHDQIRSCNIVAFLKPYMHLLCIFEPQICHFQVVALVESHSLCNNFFQKLKIKKIVSIETEHCASTCKIIVLK